MQTLQSEKEYVPDLKENRLGRNGGIVDHDLYSASELDVKFYLGVCKADEVEYLSAGVKLGAVMILPARY